VKQTLNVEIEKKGQSKGLLFSPPASNILNLDIWKNRQLREGELRDEILKMKNFQFQIEIHKIFHMAWYSKPCMLFQS
jgi:hypothetical protein